MQRLRIVPQSWRIKWNRMENYDLELFWGGLWPGFRSSKLRVRLRKRSRKGRGRSFDNLTSEFLMHPPPNPGFHLILYLLYHWVLDYWRTCDNHPPPPRPSQECRIAQHALKMCSAYPFLVQTPSLASGSFRAWVDPQSCNLSLTHRPVFPPLARASAKIVQHACRTSQRGHKFHSTINRA